MRFRTGWKRGAVLLLGLSLTGLGCRQGGRNGPLLGDRSRITPATDTSVFASEQDTVSASEQDSDLPEEKQCETPTSNLGEG